MEQHIAIAELTMKSLKVRRQLLEIRRQRDVAIGEHQRHVLQECEERIAVAQQQFQQHIHGISDLPEYVAAVKEKYDRNPGRYLLRKHAQIVKLVRSQQLLEDHIEIAKEHSAFIIGTIVEVKDRLHTELLERREDKEAREYLIHGRMVALMTAKIRIYYEMKEHHQHAAATHIARKPTDQTAAIGSIEFSPAQVGSLLQRLVSRKAKDRLCVL